MSVPGTLPAKRRTPIWWRLVALLVLVLLVVWFLALASGAAWAAWGFGIVLGLLFLRRVFFGKMRS